MEVPTVEENYSIEKTCRTCIKNFDNSNKMVSINSDLFTLEFGFMKLKISVNDGLPQSVCHKCAKRFAGQKEFRQMCDSSQDVLEKYFKSSIIQAKGKTVDSTILKGTNNSFAKKTDDGTPFEFLNINDDYDAEENDLKKEANVEKGHSQTQQNNEEMVEEKPIIDAKEDFIVQIEENKQPYNVQEDIDDDIDSFDGNSQEDDLENADDEDDNEDEEQSDEENKNGVFNENLRCHICDRYFRRSGNLRRHLKSHDLKNEKTAIKKKVKKRKYDHLCNKCGKRFTKAKGLQLHISASQCVSEDHPECRFCKDVLPSVAQLEIHLKELHPIDRPHMCPICKKTFQSVSNRNTHMHSHNKVDAFKCDSCGQSFKCKVYLNKHIKIIHTVANHECCHCHKTFNNTAKYEYHMKSHDPNKQFQCKFCEKSFLQQHHLLNHERIHTGDRPYLCSICGKDFKQEHNFKFHILKHQGIREHKCDICGKDFIQRGNLVQHMKHHSGIKPHQCEHCGKEFVQKSYLTVHLRTHTGEKPFHCDTCDKKFVQPAQLKYHQRSAHGGPVLNLFYKTEKAQRKLKQKLNVEKTISTTTNTGTTIAEQNEQQEQTLQKDNSTSTIGEYLMI